MSLHISHNAIDRAGNAANTACGWLLVAGIILGIGYCYGSGSATSNATEEDVNRAYASGFEQGQDDCGGIDCTTYTIAIGQAAKEARQGKKATVWAALEGR